MKKKVVFLVNHDVVIYNFRKELAQELINEGYDVYVVSPNGERIPKLVDLGCKFIEQPVDRHGLNPAKDLELLLSYKKILKRLNPLIVLTYTIKPNIYGGLAARSLSIPYIANITGLGTALQKKGWLQNFLVYLYKLSLKKAEKVYLQNQSNLEFFKNHLIFPEKLSLLPGSGVNLEEFSLLSYPQSDIIKFVFISRIMKEKGIEEYLYVAREIKKSFEKVEFHICGFIEDQYLELIKKLETEEIVIYHGMVMNIREILKDMHCTIHPSYYPEGISNVLLESAASGRPIITTDNPGCKEVISSQGYNGYIVPIKDKFSLKKAVINFIDLSYEKKRLMGENGRNFVEKNFDRKIVVSTYINVINKVLLNHGEEENK